MSTDKNESSAEVINLEALSGEIGEGGEKKEVFNGIPPKDKVDLLGLETPEIEEEEVDQEKQAELEKRAEETGKTVEELKAEEAKEEQEKADQEKQEELEKKAEETGKTVEEIQAEEAKEAQERADQEKQAELEKRAEETGKTVEELKAEEEAKVKPYVKSLKSLFGNSITHVIQEDEEGEEVEVPIEDLDMTQDVYEEIVKAKIDELQEKAKEGTISAEGISEFTRELIEIDRLGGDVNALLQSKESYTDALDKLDLTNPDDQKRAIYLRYKAAGQHSEEEINILIKGYEDKGQLSDKAETADEEIRGAVKQQLDKAKKEAQDKKDEREKTLKKYKKDLREKFNQFDLADNVKTKAVNLATKEDENGRFEIDNLYYQMRNDPDMAAKLTLFILDTKEYDKQVSSKVKKETQLNGANKITLVKKDSGVSDLKTGKKSGGSKSIILEDLNK